jgi:hypothetical protein
MDHATSARRRFVQTLAGLYLCFAAMPCLGAPLPSQAAAVETVSSPQPTATSGPHKRKLFVRGTQFIVVGAAISPRVQSEFRPGSTAGITSIEGWQTSETTLLERFHVLSFTDYRSFAYDHVVTDPVATIGGKGRAIVPSFRVHDDELESGGGVRIAPHVFAGLMTFKRQETNGYPPLEGIGYTVMLAPRVNAALSPYGWVSYEPNAGGIYALSNGSHTALTYRGSRYRFGVLVSEPNTRLALDIGFAGEHLFNRSNVAAPVSESSIMIGLGDHF